MVWIEDACQQTITQVLPHRIVPALLLLFTGWDSLEWLTIRTEVAVWECDANEVYGTSLGVLR